jgi:membrane fusion protein (multidrug efflux system)
VRTGSVQDGQWFVTDGLKAGDKVVIEGFQKFAPGDKVRPLAFTEADAAVDTAAAGQTTQARR